MRKQHKNKNKSKNMTTKIKKQGSTDLPRFIVGALATAGASVANGATVQITFLNNVVGGGNGSSNFLADLTGDGAGENLSPNYQDFGTFMRIAAVYYGPKAIVRATARAFSASALVDPNFYGNVGGVASGRNLVGFSFTDSRINGGGATNGWLDLEARGVVGGFPSIQIHRLIFDDASPLAPLGVAYTDPAFAEWAPSGVSVIPEPGTNLGLLALGAGGLLIRRRLKRAA
jgi:hypothetical protein